MIDTTKHTVKKLLLKLLMVLLVLAALDVIYYYTLYPKDLTENCTLMALSERAMEGVDIVYLGESSNHTYSDADTDKRFICEMIDDMLPEHRVGNLAKDACHAGVYYDILRNIPAESPVKTVSLVIVGVKVGLVIGSLGNRRYARSSGIGLFPLELAYLVKRQVVPIDGQILVCVRFQTYQ